MAHFIKLLAQNDFIYKSVCKNTLGYRVFRANYSVIPRKTSSSNDEPIEIENPFEKERKICILCKLNITPDYKNVKLLSQFQSPYTGRIYGRHITGLCKQKQTEVESAIIKAQNCAIMPTYHKDIHFVADPKLFDPERPIRPHKY